MKFIRWRRKEGRTQQWCAQALGCDQSVISRIERCDGRFVPRDADFLKRVYILTRGEVRPNDFYDLPAWEAELIAAEAEAELARAAA